MSSVHNGMHARQSSATCVMCFWNKSARRPTPLGSFVFVVVVVVVVCIKKNSNHFTDVLPTCCLLAFILLHGILSIVPLALVYASEGNFT